MADTTMMKDVGRLLAEKIFAQDVVDTFTGRPAWRKQSSTAGYFAALGAGIFIGAGIALWLSPKSAAEIRDDVTQGLSALREQIEKAMQSVGAAGGQPTQN